MITIIANAPEPDPTHFWIMAAALGIGAFLTLAYGIGKLP
jgi:hypothetical protein